MRRLALAVLLAVAGLTVGVGQANAATPPVPDNPMANASVNAFAPAPNPLPPANTAWDPNNLLAVYGTAGPTFHYYDLNPLEEVGASFNVQVANGAMDLPKIAISAVASLATWVFNPSSFLDQLKTPTDDSAKALHDNLATPWLPVILIAVAIAIGWGARTGKLGMAFTRVTFSLIGLALVGLSIASPSSIAGSLSGVVTETVAGVLVPAGEESVKSDADAVAAAQARANVGAVMLGPLWRTAVYDPWVSGTLGSPTSKTAQDNAGPLFQAQAFTWNEAAALDGKKDETNAAVKKDQDDWTAVAKKVNDSDPNAYRYLQGSNMSAGPVIVSYVVTAACLPFIAVALLMVLAGYLALFLLAALLPVIGLAVIIAPGVLGKVGRFLAAVLINTVVMAAASVVILKLANALLGTGNLLFSVLIISVASWVAWRFLKSFRGFRPVAASQATSTAAVASSVESVKKTTSKVTKKATKKATKPHGEPTKVDAGAPASASTGEAPAGARPASRPATVEGQSPYVPVGRPSKTEQQALYVPAAQVADPGEPHMPAAAPEAAPEPRTQPAAATMGAGTRTGSATPYVPVPAPEGDESVPDTPADIPGARRLAPGAARAAYIPPRPQFDNEEISA